MNRLQDKVAIVTGAAGNLGFTGAHAMAAEGARVVMMDISPSVADRAAELAKQGLEVVPYVGDVSDESDIREMVNLAARTYGRLDVLWNNAGLIGADWLDRDTDVVGVTRDHLMRTLEVNLLSVFLGSKYAIPVMAEGGGGSIINTSSIQSAGGDLALVSYGTSKAAIDYLTQSIATSYGHLRIRCNAIAPGLVPPPAVDDGRAKSAPVQLLRDSQMLPYVGEPSDVSNAVVFLASDESKFITGQRINVDGGATGHLPTLSDRRKAA
ncbi:SDR family NAD(P)-dependent oxidoreductase [Paractinoplanes brasiliensis]|uniref:NAD(P)-dependent dehydrogenase (Short-subunit alcohol dehydrogenase family) n=1 Tax=Paractinoplanes brasiliensis TaxID=52695 RepID=A0A4R6JLG0_9ACTN|nr:SDR family oxidoreductase [Actinoplanes brasiliensis]TDO37140.1 NAD(P)-dependent dehydrogenase (short-subunit alcohol dehydrogenase family) [Actinoplanes brasiliensis]GID33430.1 7-alpha-hydroxysteroid dehydrogenase [Actinoplanes brasiliensis]